MVLIVKPVLTNVPLVLVRMANVATKSTITHVIVQEQVCITQHRCETFVLFIRYLCCFLIGYLWVFFIGYLCLVKTARVLPSLIHLCLLKKDICASFFFRIFVLFWVDFCHIFVGFWCFLKRIFCSFKKDMCTSTFEPCVLIKKEHLCFFYLTFKLMDLKKKIIQYYHYFFLKSFLNFKRNHLFSMSALI